MPRYGFRCRSCGLEFEVSRAMSDAGRTAACPVDGKGADRLFTAPMISIRQGEIAVPASPPSEGPAKRNWSLPFFPKDAKASAQAHQAAAKPRHVLPAGSSKPTRFKHFGHWHPAGTPPHTHAPRRPRRAKRVSPPEI
jgi:putative FmdB family regulatory protein